jgi:hypothetical protein
MNQRFIYKLDSITCHKSHDEGLNIFNVIFIFVILIKNIYLSIN